MLTFKKLLANADRKQRKAMIAAKVEDMIADRLTKILQRNLPKET
jgi:hypothetical protein